MPDWLVVKHDYVTGKPKVKGTQDAEQLETNVITLHRGRARRKTCQTRSKTSVTFAFNKVIQKLCA